MDQYLLIPFLGGWTSIYQLFWCSPGVQGFDTLPYRLSCFLVTSQCFRRSIPTVADKFAIVQVLVGLNLHFLPQTINSKVWISGHSEGQFRNLGKWQVTPLETEFDLGYSQKDQQEALSKMTLGTNQQAKASRNLNFSSEQLSQRMRWTQWSLSPFPILRQASFRLLTTGILSFCRTSLREHWEHWCRSLWLRSRGLGTLQSCLHCSFKDEVGQP